MNTYRFRSFLTPMLAMNLTISVEASRAVDPIRLDPVGKVTPEFRNVMKGNFYEMFLKNIGRKQNHSPKPVFSILRKASRKVKPDIVHRSTVIKPDIVKCTVNKDFVGGLGNYFPLLDHVNGLAGLEPGFPML